MKTKIKVEVYPNRVGVHVDADGNGVFFSLTHRAAVELADKLNAALDDPSDADAGELLRKVINNDLRKKKQR